MTAALREPLDLLPLADLTVPPTWTPTARPSLRLPAGTRSVEVANTLARVRPYFERLGVGHVRIDVNEDLGVPIFWAYQRQKLQRGYGQREWNFGGKGATEELATASVMMESLERVFGSRLHHPELVRAHLRDVERQAVHPEDLAIPKGSFDASKLQEWGWARSLMSGQTRLVHANFLLTPYVATVGDDLFEAEFNGLASGNNLEEAVLHALYELIERDAWVLAHHRKLSDVRLLSRDSIVDARSIAVLDALEARGARVALFDLTRDRDVALRQGARMPITVGVTVFDDGFFAPVAPMASGTSYDPDIALFRALTEVCQWRANLIFLRDELPRVTRGRRSAQRRARFLAERDLAVVDIAELRAPGSAEAMSIQAQIDVTLGALRAIGADVYMAHVASIPGVLDVVKLVTGGLQVLTSGVDYLDDGETDKTLSRRATRRLAVEES